jgi:hypothetical protein
MSPQPPMDVCALKNSVWEMRHIFPANSAVPIAVAFNRDLRHARTEHRLTQGLDALFTLVAFWQPWARDFEHDPEHANTRFNAWLAHTIAMLT